MDKKETRETLKDLKMLKAHLSTSIGNLQSKLEAKLEAEPELRHGDYGIADGDNVLIVSQQNKEPPMTSFNLRGTPCGDVKNGIDCTRDMVVLGNIFDDLAAMSEPLEVMNPNMDVELYINEHGNIEIRHNNNVIVVINKEYFSNFRNDILRLIHTAKRSGK